MDRTIMINSKFQIPNSKISEGITLLEILVAISLLTLVLLAGGGIYISGWNMFRDAQYTSQAQRNAVIPMAHMAKQIQQAASECDAIDTNGDGNNERLQFMQYGTPPAITSRYDFQSGDRHIIYVPNTDTPASFNIIGTNIQGCTFTERHSNTDGITVVIDITATDNRQENPYQLTSRVTARYSAVPPVY